MGYTRPRVPNIGKTLDPTLSLVKSSMLPYGVYSVQSICAASKATPYNQIR